MKINIFLLLVFSTRSICSGMFQSKENQLRNEIEEAFESSYEEESEAELDQKPEDKLNDLLSCLEDLQNAQIIRYEQLKIKLNFLRNRIKEERADNHYEKEVSIPFYEALRDRPTNDESSINLQDCLENYNAETMKRLCMPEEFAFNQKNLAEIMYPIPLTDHSNQLHRANTIKKYTERVATLCTAIMFLYKSEADSVIRLNTKEKSKLVETAGDIIKMVRSRVELEYADIVNGQRTTLPDTKDLHKVLDFSIWILQHCK